MHCVTVCHDFLIAQIFELLKSCIIHGKWLSVVEKKILVFGVFIWRTLLFAKISREMLRLQSSHVISSLF